MTVFIMLQSYDTIIKSRGFSPSQEDTLKKFTTTKGNQTSINITGQKIADQKDSSNTTKTIKTLAHYRARIPTNFSSSKYLKTTAADFKNLINHIKTKNKLPKIAKHEINLGFDDRTLFRRHKLALECNKMIKSNKAMGQRLAAVRKEHPVQRLRTFTVKNLEHIRPVADNLHSPDEADYQKIFMCAPPKTGTTSWQGSIGVGYFVHIIFNDPK